MLTRGKSFADKKSGLAQVANPVRFQYRLINNEDMKTHAKSKRRAGNGRRKWSGRVTRESNALDLEQKVFTFSNPRHIAQSLKRSAERSTRRKATPFQSAMSMLNFYLNRAGRTLPQRQKKILTRSKDELRKLFNRRSTRRATRKKHQTHN